MFEGLPLLPSDPILGLSVAFRDDPNPNKVDLGVGVYRNDAGETPIMAAVRAAEQERLRRETTKAYTFPAGYPGANDAANVLLLGADHPALTAARVHSIQTPGGCGALRVAAELIVRARPQARVWVSDPSWANHVPLLGGAGLALEEYPYYDYANHCWVLRPCSPPLRTCPPAAGCFFPPRATTPAVRNFPRPHGHK